MLNWWNSTSGLSENHYNDVRKGTMASQITSLTIVCSTVYSAAYQRKHQSSSSVAFVGGILRWLVNSPHKWSVTRKMSPFDDVTMHDMVCVLWFLVYQVGLCSSLLSLKLINTVYTWSDPVFYLWASKASSIDRRRCIHVYNVFSHWPRVCWPIDKTWASVLLYSTTISTVGGYEITWSKIKPRSGIILQWYCYCY